MQTQSSCEIICFMYKLEVEEKVLTSLRYPITSFINWEGYMVLERVKKLEEAMTESQKKTRAEIEARLRAQILGEMEEEMASIRKREEASKAKCAALEKELEEKVRQADESQKRLAIYYSPTTFSIVCSCERSAAASEHVCRSALFRRKSNDG
ncbi:unnamed protein product [Strongylus vulgaris]|uniref:Uncharacterized protein n=1 Tax=Strongylus vulgaris TaxID=40348 RepID=A0A3P7KD20_STRVU|nr:unnamed protein product [Strongylus vulgaris]